MRTTHPRFNAEALYFEQGNFTIAIVIGKGSGIVQSVGVTKRNPNLDNHNGDRGKIIALRRALLDRAVYLGAEEL